MPSSGKVYTMDDNLPFGMRPDEEGYLSAWWAANRNVRAGAEGDDTVCLSLQLGNLLLQGRGQRGGLRCRSFVGTVLWRYPGGDDPINDPTTWAMVGRFSMQLALPSKTDTSMLESRYRKRIETRPPPLSGFPRTLTEEEAKSAWLERRYPSARPGRPSFPPASSSYLSEDEAKRAWLAARGLDPPTNWGQHGAPGPGRPP